jgi:hypothetical protein
LVVLIVAPRMIRRRIESGKQDEAKAKVELKLIWPIGCVLIGLGILKIFAGF